MPMGTEPADQLCVTCGHSRLEHLRAGCVHVEERRPEELTKDPPKQICDCLRFVAPRQKEHSA